MRASHQPSTCEKSVQFLPRTRPNLNGTLRTSQLDEETENITDHEGFGQPLAFDKTVWFCVHTQDDAT